MNPLTDLPDAILSVAMSYLHAEGSEMRVRDRENLRAMVRHLGDDFPKLKGLLDLPSVPGCVMRHSATAAGHPRPR